MRLTKMITNQDIHKYAKHVAVDIHAVHRYQARVEKISVTEAVRKLRSIYLRGKELTPASLAKVDAFIRYKEEAVYIKYGRVVVVAESGDRYSETIKKILTCYLYKNSKFDEKSTERDE